MSSHGHFVKSINKSIKLKLKLTLYHMFFDKVLKVKHDLLP